MIKSVQSSERVINNRFIKNNTVNEKSKPSFNNNSVNSELRAAQTKFGIACLWAATQQFGNAELKQQLASAMAHKNYCETCLK